MDEARRRVLLAELEDATTERDRLSIFIETLRERLGVGPSDDQSPPDGAEARGLSATTTPQGNDPVSLIYDGELTTMSFPKATAEVLRRWSPEPYKRPIKTPVLVKALQKGGLDVKSARQLYRTLYNARALHSLPGGQWGLAAWYPDLVRAKKATAAAAHPADDDGPATSGDDFLPQDAEGENNVEEEAAS